MHIIGLRLRSQVIVFKCNRTSDKAIAERVTVALIPAAAGDLRRIQARTGLSTTDLVNRAITTYNFIDAQMRAGRDLIIRDNSTGECQLVRFL